MRGIFAAAGLGLFVACASAPPKAKTVETARPVPAPTPTSRPTSTQETRKVLPPLDFLKPTAVRGNGRCLHDFDCYDTSGFPAEGHRWDCIKRKCTSVALPVFGGGSVEPATQEKTQKRVQKRRRLRSSR